MKYLISLLFIAFPGIATLQSQNCIWVEGNWGACEGDCGSEMETRLVLCQCDGMTVADANCDPGTKPPTSQSCAPTGPFSWEEGDWSNCSEDCGEGVETRTVDCEDGGGNVVDDCYCVQQKPPDTRICNLGDCEPNLHVIGSLRFEDGNEVEDRVLVSDSQGNASWQDIDSINVPEASVTVTTFQNNYSHYGGGFGDVTFYKHNGRVYIEGVARRDDDVMDNQVIFVLPVGYRPSKSHILYGQQNASGCRIDVNTGGEVSLVSTSESLNWVSLSGISFRL